MWSTRGDSGQWEQAHGQCCISPADIDCRRACQVPATYIDVLPDVSCQVNEGETPAGGVQHMRNAAGLHESLPRVHLLVCDQLQTKPDRFGIFRKYFDRPSHDPDSELTLEDLAGLSVPGATVEHGAIAKLFQGEGSGTQPYWPFPNLLTFMLSNWFYDMPSGEHSGPDFDRLVAVVSHLTFEPGDVQGFSMSVRNKLLDRINDPTDHAPQVLGHWWHNVLVQIQIPEGKGPQWTSDAGHSFEIPGLHHRSITEIVREIFETQTNLHYTPFKMWWKPPFNAGAPAERVYSNLYSASAFHDSHREVNFDQVSQVAGRQLEKTVAALMIWSDSTHLAQFGTAHLWPI
ncbi:hypothetical protein K439DRAFT_1619082 [Ramaria rubella]|nr:hypothetical protein K439DRAFT_1619082 [Ramaria rubella]